MRVCEMVCFVGIHVCEEKVRSFFEFVIASKCITPNLEFGRKYVMLFYLFFKVSSLVSVLTSYCNDTCICPNFKTN